MTPALAAGAAAVALIELDATAAAQVMVSRPAVFAPLLGLAYGDPVLGTLAGVTWELLTLEAPVGGHMPINATAAAGATVLLGVGDGALPLEAALPFAAAAGWAHRRLETSLRRRRAACAASCESRLAAGLPPRIGLAAALELGKEAAMTFGILAVVLAARPVAAAAWQSAGDVIQAALQAGALVAPWIGMAALLRALKVGT